MRYLFSILLFTFFAGVSFAQDSLSIEEMLKMKYGEDYKQKWNSEEAKCWHDAEKIVYSCTDYILNTPDDYKNNKRNKMLQFVFLWVKKGEYDLPYNDEFAQKIREINQMLWVHYLVCLSNVYLEDTTRNNEEIKINASRRLLIYIDNKSNISDNSSLTSQKIWHSVELQELRNAHSERKIRRVVCR